MLVNPPRRPSLNGSALTGLLVHQQSRWQRGERVLVESCLAQQPHLRDNAEAVLELLLHEVLLRQQCGETPNLIEYQHRFPNLAEELAIQFEVEHLLAASSAPWSAPPPTICELPSSDTSKTGTIGAPGLSGYEILGVLGRGGMGVVYKARQVGLKRLVALKIVKGGAHAAPEEHERFRREAEAVARLHHPNIIQIHEVGEHQGLPFFSLELMEGGSLGDKLDHAPQPPRQAAQLVETLARAMHYAHQQGILHRDLKPANVLLDADGAPKITDFGLAKRLDEQGLTQTGAVMGTPSYMAPEQARGSKDLGPAADVYALGAVLYEMLTGRPPFQSESIHEVLLQVLTREPVAPHRLAPHTPRNLEIICLKCLEKDPAKRYASAGELADRLRMVLENRPIPDRPVSLIERGWRWGLRNPTQALAGVLAAATVAALVVLTIVYAFARQQSDAAQRLRHEQAQTRAALDEAEIYRGQAEELSTDLVLTRGAALCEQGDTARGLLWLTHALEMAPVDSTALQQTIRRNLTAWRNRIHPLRQVYLHQGEVFAVAFRPVGNVLLSGSRDRTARLWDVHTGQPIGRPLEHPDLVFGVAFSPDGKTAATACWDGAVRLWDAASGKPVGQPLPGPSSHHTPRGPSGPTMVFSPNGKLLLTARDGNAARLWETATGKPLGRLLSHRDQVTCVAFSSDGKLVATTSADRTARVWEAATGTPLGAPLLHGSLLAHIAFSPDGQTLLTGWQDHAAQLWEVPTGRRIGAPLQHQNWISAVAFTPDSQLAATASADGTVQLWETATGKPVGLGLTHQGRVEAIAFSPDGALLVTGSFGAAQVWETATGKRRGPALPHRDTVRAVAFSPDGKTVLTGCRDRTVRLWKVMDATDLPLSMPHQGPIHFACFAQGGKTILTGSEDRTARLWDAATGKPRSSPLRHQGVVQAVAVSPDGKTVATAGREGTAQLWEPATGKPRGKALRHPGQIKTMAFSPDGKLVATGGSPATALLWVAATGETIGSTLLHEQLVGALAFSPDGKLLGTASDDGTARLWNTANGAPVGPPLRHRDEVWAVVFSPDGKTLATAGLDNAARLWDVGTGRLRFPPLRHQGAICALTFSPDGKALATASYDGTARLWEAASGQPLSIPLAHQGQVYALGFSPDSSILATGGSDGTVRMWYTTTGKPFGMPLPHQGAVKAVAFSPDGKSLLTGSYDKTARFWKLPAPIEGDVQRIRLWIQIRTGMELDADNIVRVLDARTWWERRQQLQALGGPLAE